MITEGYMDFEGYQTYYRIVGDLNSKKTPILLLHGGPGSTHNSQELLDEVSEDDRAVIMYDQLGCGKSPAENRTDLFNKETWVKELIALRKHLNLNEIHLLGHSWGGMLALEYMCHYNPQGIKSLVLSSTLPSSKLWGKEQHRMIKFLPVELQEAIKKAEADGDWENAEVKRAEQVFMERHCKPELDENAPECLTRAKGSGSLAYLTAWGPNEFSPAGNLKDWDVTSELGKVKVPALLFSGVNDESSPLINKVMLDGLANAKWHLFNNSRHMSYYEQHDEYISLLTSWLNIND